MKHISVRVAWHDNNWNGTVCKCPIQNTYCSHLRRVSDAKDGAKENSVASELWCRLSQNAMPACIAEAGGFMNGLEYQRNFTHVYAKYSNFPHSVLEPTIDDVPAFSFYGTPFRYMLCEYQEELIKKYPSLPEDVPNPHNKKNSWIFGADRQRAILNLFREQIIPEQSLVVFYTKNGNPIDEDCKRLIIGMGQITTLYQQGEYNSKATYTYPFWDIKMSHSIRPDLKVSNGFLLPYHEYLALDEEDVLKKTGKSKAQCIEEIKITLNKLGGSQQMLNQLSYVCEHIDNHNMLIILNAARCALENIIAHKLIGGDWQRQLRWIDTQIGKVKEQMGPFPSFAESLRAAGYNYSYMIEQDLRNLGYCKPKDNPWTLFEDILSGKLDTRNTAYSHLIRTYRNSWYNTGNKQREILQFLSRINLTDKQIERIYERNNNYYNEVIQNPYILGEDCNTNIPEDIITTEMIDEGFMADPDIQGNYMPSTPSLVDSPIDKRRIRAIIIAKLKDASNEGDTLLSQFEVEEYLTKYLEEHDHCSIPKGFIDANKDFISKKVNYLVGPNKEIALQYIEFTKKEAFVSKKFEARSRTLTKNEIKEDWEEIIKSVIENFDETNTRSVEAIKDQARALDVMANYRLSVLTGPAGTGKTKVVEAFLQSSLIRNQGVLLLAPTGKARVRLGNMAGLQAYTVAQFFVRQRSYNYKTKQPEYTEKSLKFSEASTVIIDECSMLTIDDFYYLFKLLSLSAIERIILIGDPYQLPPIGPGRPFADLCAFLEKNKLQSLVRLNIVVRTAIKGDESDTLQLASWFTGMKPDKKADDIFNKMASGNLNNDLSVYTWVNTDDLNEQLCEVLSQEFETSLGGLSSYIEHLLGIGADQLQATINNPITLEAFQIISPVKYPLWGTVSLNSILQDLLGIRGNPKYSISIDGQRIFARDKVIQLINERKYPYNRDKSKEQLSNGQIGFVYNFVSGYANVAFAGLPGATFGYRDSDSDINEPSIALAYAITIHKSQGSDFDTVMAILPKTGKLLSRELIYTAITRSKKRLILFIEDDTNWIKSFSSPEKSVVAKRNTNLFGVAVRGEDGTPPYVDGLIHQTIKKEFVRSKSEVIIANELHHKDLEFQYDEPLRFDENKMCLPDFTFESDSGEKIIWEHLGMLNLPNYRKRWEEKLKMYEDNGFILGDNLFITVDKEDGGISTPDILAVIDKIIERIDD